MKRILLILPFLLLLILTACKKDETNKTPPTPPPPAILKDTLATGWNKINVDDSSDLSDISFIGNTGFTGGTGPNIFKSIDGGDTWTTIPKPSNISSDDPVINLSMGNEDSVIFAFPYKKYLVTHDGGTNVSLYNESDSYISDVFFVNDSTAYAGGFSFWKTVDAGIKWTKLYTFSNFGSYYTLCFLNEQTGWDFRAQDGLYKTTNGGVDWQQIPTPFDVHDVGKVLFQNEDTGYVSSGHNVEKTTNGGSTWTRVFSGTGEYHDIEFVSANTGFITDSTHIYKTMDGGSTWTTEVALQSSEFVGLHFNDPTHGWACGLKGTVLKFNP